MNTEKLIAEIEVYQRKQDTTIGYIIVGGVLDIIRKHFEPVSGGIEGDGLWDMVKNTPKFNFSVAHHDAKAFVQGNPLFKKFISGTPLENDIPVWMAEFAAVHPNFKQPTPAITAEEMDKVREALESWRDAVKDKGFILVANNWNTKGEEALFILNNLIGGK